MGQVYRLGGVYGTEYFNSKKAASRCKPGNEEPESFERVDASSECNRLIKLLEETDDRFSRMRCLVEELLDICEAETVSGTEIISQLRRICSEN